MENTAVVSTAIPPGGALMMDLNDLFLSCRKGDLQRVQYLVKEKEIEINVHDKWDSTPLYYACLCGHIDVVCYLLENGARCEANTFDGERCIYGALSPKIRNILRNYKVVTSKTLRRDLYESFLQNLLECGQYSDVKFVVHGEQFTVHKCILFVRSDYFAEMFDTRWKDRSVIHISNHLVRPRAFAAVMQYLYTGRLETHVDQVEDCVRLARQCKLHSLIRHLEDTIKKNDSFACTKPGTKVTTLVIEPDEEMHVLQQDLAVLAEQALPPSFSHWVGGSELPFLPDLHRPQFTDLCISVEGHHFYCHKTFLCVRSDYFQALVEDHFSESTTDAETNVLLITLHDVSVEVFINVLYYIYQNTTKLTPSTTYDVLTMADIYLLPGLKQQCAAFLASCVENTNAICLLQTARAFGLPRLEDQCTEFIARNLEEFIDDEGFHQIVIEDAKEVKERQETDSIAIVDDVRYYINSNVQTFSAMQDANEKLKLIDYLLEKLELDA